MAYTTIDDPSAHFQTMLYTGNASLTALTNDGNSDLQPDWIWIKDRDNARSHEIYDSSRGATKRIQSDSNGAESTQANNLQAFQSDGFQIGSGNGVNQASQTLAAWQWKANGGTTSSNSDGSLASTVQANTTAGFSIVTWTADGGGAKTIGHGLGAVPKWIITKNRTDASTNWQIYHASNTSAPQTEVIYFTTGATQDYDGFMADTAPTSSVFTVGGDGSMNGTSGKNIVAYCFAEKQGYSKFGGYTGNGNADGPFVYTGFKPAWLMTKRTDSTSDWNMYDNKRNTFNKVDKVLQAEGNDAEYTSGSGVILDFLSNGFKVRGTGSGINADGGSYIYMAFAQHPFVSSKGVPATAR